MRPEFPLTTFLADLTRFSMGALSSQDIRTRWKQGEYRGINPAHAKGYAREFGV